jgi:phospholipid/cholesterol/gamma-HCH transport system substrate-binding protein
MVMLSQRFIESLVGLFLIFALIALTVLAFQVSGLMSLLPEKGYVVSAAFDDIGGLKVRSPVKIGGVQIGEVEGISLDPLTFKAVVKMHIHHQYNDIPDDSSAGIYTAGLLGDNYIAITPMYNTSFLKNGSNIEMTNSAMVLEKLIGDFIYSIKNSGGDTSNSSSNKNGSNGDNENKGDKNAKN